MKKLYFKIPAMIAVTLTLVSLALVLIAVLMSRNEPSGGCAPGTAFGFLLVGLIGGGVALCFYALDALLSVIKACMRIHPLENGVTTGLFLLVVILLFKWQSHTDLLLVVSIALLLLPQVFFLVQFLKSRKKKKPLTEADGVPAAEE